MKRVLIIGAGGVATVAAHKVAKNTDVFGEIMIASRTKSKCDALKEKLEGTTKTKIRTAQVDADHPTAPCGADCFGAAGVVATGCHGWTFLGGLGLEH